jgi:hypothetical protein
MRRVARVFTLALLLALIASIAAVGAGADEHDVRVPTTPERPGSAPDLELIAPAKDVLSGRPWLLAEGIDPGLTRRPGWDALTRMDWRDLDTVFAEPPVPRGRQGGMQAGPTMQAPGGAGALVPFRDPAPAFSRDVLITRDFSQSPFQTEPHLAVNPNDPEHVVVGVIDYNFPTITSYVSLDGGQNWEGPRQVPYLLDDRVSGGDPVVAFDRDENVYLANISIGVEEFEFGPIVTFLMVSSIVVGISDDGGFTWPQTVSTARSGVDVGELRLDPLGRLRGVVVTSFLDKPWMTVGPHPDDDGRDVVYVTYTDFEVEHEILWVGEVPTFVPRALNTTIRMVTSDDNGQTWTEPVDVSPTVLRAYGEIEEPVVPGVVGTNRVVQGSQPVVGPDGTVHVAWLDTTDDGSQEGRGEMYVARSTDGGETWTDPRLAADFNEVGFRPRTSFFRFWGSSFPQLAIGPEGELYLVYVGRPDDRPGDDGDVFLVRSLDDGNSWSSPVRLNDDDGDALQFFPAVDVDPDGGVHVMWGDMRDDPAQTRYHIYYTSSEDQGDTWGFELEEGVRVGDTRVTDFASNPNFGFPLGLFIGDYFAIEATDEDVYMVWADTRLGEFGPINQKIGFARQRPVSTPEVFVSPPGGPGGQGITIQGFDFQPDLNVFVQLDDATIATARTDAEGFFETQVFTPVVGEGAQTVRILDDSGNVAETSFFTEFGFGDIELLHEDLRERIGVVADAPRVDELIDELTQVQGLLREQQLAGPTPAANAGWLAAGLLAVIFVAGGTSWALVRRNDRNHDEETGPDAEASEGGDDTVDEEAVVADTGGGADPSAADGGED